MADKNPAFAVKPDDPKDVSWGLSTANACWTRGERSEALKWLRRAVEAASEAEHDERALELAKVAADLATQIGSMAPPQAGPAAPVAIPRASALPAAPRPAIVAPKATPVISKVDAPKVSPVVTKSPVAKKANRKSITNEGPRSRAAVEADKASGPSLDKTQDDKPTADVPPPRKRSTSRADRGETGRRSSRTDEIDQWPTEVTGPSASATAGAVRASQAVRVLVWKAPDGTVRVSAVVSGRKTPADAIEATLAALEPSADLVTLLSS